MMPLNLSRMQLYELVIQATAIHFSVTPEVLTTGKSTRSKAVDAYKKHMCFYMIRKNDDLLSREFIASKFNTGKSTVEYGEKSIEKLTFYRRTVGDINDIQNLIDNFKNLKQQSLLNNLCHTQQNSIQL